MRLKNKKTGEIVDFRYLQSDYVAPLVLTTYKNDKPEMYSYTSLAELNEEWDDYEEPKEYWYINTEMYEVDYYEKGKYYEIEKFNKAIGNYFDTQEEAEKAVEKLKALTEAKKDGLKIKGYYYNHEDLVILADIGKCNKLTLDTLFGKEID